jgi:hypothetical protein
MCGAQHLHQERRRLNIKRQRKAAIGGDGVGWRSAGCNGVAGETKAAGDSGEMIISGWATLKASKAEETAGRTGSCCLHNSIMASLEATHKA